MIAVDSFCFTDEEVDVEDSNDDEDFIKVSAIVSLEAFGVLSIA